MTSNDVIQEMSGIVRDAVNANRDHGVKTAVAMAAQQLGLGYRRAKAFWNGEVRSVQAWEADMLREKRRAVIEERHKRLAHELALLERQLHDLGAMNDDLRDRARTPRAGDGGARSC